MDDTTRRVWWLVVAIGAIGSAVTLREWGVRAAAGFAVGAVISAANYRWLKRTVDLLGSGERPKKASGGLLALRYLILGAGAYVTINFFELNVLAVLFGTLAAVAAVILEILYELIYART
jgi:hypothetical protein